MDIEEQNELDMFEEVGENWDESDIRSLIAHVKANQFLVNKSERDFKNKEKKDDAWKIIAMLLNKSETEVQKKWKSLRTVFSRKLGQLKQKMPSGSGADAKGKISRIEWEYWGDMQFLIPHIRHKLNRTSNFHNKQLQISPAFLGSPSNLASSSNLASPSNSGNSVLLAFPSHLASPLNSGNSVLKSARETDKNTIKCTAIESLPLQNADFILPENPSSASLLTQTLSSEITVVSTNDSSHLETLSSSSCEQIKSMSTNESESKKYSSSMKSKRKVPTTDKFYTKRKKKLESCSARMSEASDCMKETLTAVTQSLKEPSGSDDLQYFACLLPIFKNLNDDQKTECLQTLLNAMIEFGKKTSIN
ncbi:uncharacterized protein LOC143894201 isoform X1 [Temnothorax americanus]|uniref:uncharacterized protein LOC143894201 isoform X1 n=1 Tax=Temnothorax americanus TaxID=1964332 RepID=UPI004068D3C0